LVLIVVSGCVLVGLACFCMLFSVKLQHS